MLEVSKILIKITTRRMIVMKNKEMDGLSLITLLLVEVQMVVYWQVDCLKTRKSLCVYLKLAQEAMVLR